ncbi:hypothetical protein LP421_28785 [Rhizobium sp. RCAM05350]|nr:hypothetical protein LP421_28785 [Rhizobium sp. RCAM05350]
MPSQPSKIRVTAVGLHIEGFDSIEALQRLATRARELKKPVVTLKVGKSEAAQLATVSHTASLAGNDAVSSALLERLGIGRVDTLPELLETLKLLHLHPPLKNYDVSSMSCSGGEASLMADAGVKRKTVFRALKEEQCQPLREKPRRNGHHRQSARLSHLRLGQSGEADDRLYSDDEGRLCAQSHCARFPPPGPLRRQRLEHHLRGRHRLGQDDRRRCRYCRQPWREHAGRHGSVADGCRRCCLLRHRRGAGRRRNFGRYRRHLGETGSGAVALRTR